MRRFTDESAGQDDLRLADWVGVWESADNQPIGEIPALPTRLETPHVAFSSTDKGQATRSVFRQFGRKTGGMAYQSPIGEIPAVPTRLKTPGKTLRIA